MKFSWHKAAMTDRRVTKKMLAEVSNVLPLPEPVWCCPLCKLPIEITQSRVMHYFSPTDLRTVHRKCRTAVLFGED